MASHGITYILYRWLLLTASLYLTSLIVPGIVIEGAVAAFIAAALLALVNTLIKPVLIVLTLPITILSLGLFIFIINALLLWLVGSAGINGFLVTGFGAALLGALVLSLISLVLNSILT